MAIFKVSKCQQLLTGPPSLRAPTQTKATIAKGLSPVAYKTLDKGPFFLWFFFSSNNRNHWNFSGLYQNGNFTPLKGPHRKHADRALFLKSFKFDKEYPSYELKIKWFLIRPCDLHLKTGFKLPDPRYRQLHTWNMQWLLWLKFHGPSNNLKESSQTLPIE